MSPLSTFIVPKQPFDFELIPGQQGAWHKLRFVLPFVQANSIYVDIAWLHSENKNPTDRNIADILDQIRLAGIRPGCEVQRHSTVVTCSHIGKQ